MTLKDYVDRRVKQEKTTVTAVLRDIAKSAKVSFSHLHYVYKGAPYGQVAKAKAVSKATGGKVSLDSLLGIG